MQKEELVGMLVGCIYSKDKNRSFVSVLLEREESNYAKGYEEFRCSFEGANVFNRLGKNNFLQEIIVECEYRKAPFGRNLQLYAVDLVLPDTGESLVN